MVLSLNAMGAGVGYRSAGIFNAFSQQAGNAASLFSAARDVKAPVAVAQKPETGGGGKRPVLLLIFDGWGLRENGPGHAINLANPSFYNRLLETYPWIPLAASGEAVGLPEGNPGNSEVGHLTMGSGRVFFQDLPRINKAIADGSFETNPVFLSAIDHVKKTGGTLNLMGLVSDGGVHSHINHLLALIDLAKKKGLKDVHVHAFLDGRDTPPKSAERYLSRVEDKLRQSNFSPIATVSGRYYAMDRDKRWDRTQKAYNAMVSAEAPRVSGSADAVRQSYQANVTDEFLLPVVTDPNYAGMKDGDSLLFFNFRPDRARQITQAVTDSNFTGFPRVKVPKNLYTATMTTVDETFNLPVAFTKEAPVNVLASVLSQNGLKQFHTAETEKYAHVTYFFNGGIEPPVPGEERKLVASPNVATYDLKPEMSVKEVTDEVIKAIDAGKHDFIVANFANPDMVGHTGVESAAVSAVKSVDTQLKRIVEDILKKDGVMLLTADHGKVETMIDTDGTTPFTAHTSNPVPLVLISNNPKLKLENTRPHGLSEIAPTVLDLFGLPKPPQMTAGSLLNITG